MSRSREMHEMGITFKVLIPELLAFVEPWGVMCTGFLQEGAAY